MITYTTIIFLSWVAFLLVWVVSAFGVKRDIKGGGIASAWYRYFLLRFVAVAVLIFIVLRIGTGTAHYTKPGSAIFGGNIFTPPLALGWIAAVLTVLGVAFAIWARTHLGRNWSPAPAIKEKHELVTSGPYRFVRHPIYTGMIFTTLGLALAGSIFGISVFIFSCLLFISRMRKEEHFMLELFPNEYPAYQARTKKLIPFLW